jgi:hypothetical protein
LYFKEGVGAKSSNVIPTKCFFEGDKTAACSNNCLANFLKWLVGASDVMICAIVEMRHSTFILAARLPTVLAGRLFSLDVQVFGPSKGGNHLSVCVTY